MEHETFKYPNRVVIIGGGMKRMAYQGNLLSKTMVIGIILLFIGMSIIPSIAVDTVNVENANSKSSGDDVDWWPMFRHDLNHSGYSTSNGPDTNNVLWEYEIGEIVHSSPAVVDGRVYIGSWGDKVYCLDAVTGDYIWSYKTADDVDSSPAVVEGKVYIGCDDENVYCLDAINGSCIWTYKTGHRVFSSPAVVEGKVYIGTYSPPFGYEGNVYCLDANTGDYIWSFMTGDLVFSSPAVADGKIYIGSEDDKVYCLDANTGDYIWSYKTGHLVHSSPTVVDGKVYIGSCDYNLYCLDAINGSCIWSYNTGSTVLSSPAVADGKVYFGSHDYMVYCLDANNGDYMWSYKTGDWVEYSPAVADGKVYIGSDDGNVYCLDANNGDYIWSYKAGYSVYSSPAVADGKVYISSEYDSIVYAFGELDPDTPSAPEINGPTKGVLDILYNFTFKSESPHGNDLYYWIEWADGSNSGWLGPYGSGVNITESHVWDSRGKYPVQAKAKDTNGSVSSWGVLQLNIPRNRATKYLWYQWFLERFPLLERLLSLLRVI
jgi:outer membrane protein assembly factor BamB